MFVYAGKACQGQTLQLIMKIRKLQTKKFYSSRVGTWPYPQTLDYTEKACQGQAIKLIAKIRKLRM